MFIHGAMPVFATQSIDWGFDVFHNIQLADIYQKVVSSSHVSDKVLKADLQQWTYNDIMC